MFRIMQARVVIVGSLVVLAAAGCSSGGTPVGPAAGKRQSAPSAKGSPSASKHLSEQVGLHGPYLFAGNPRLIIGVKADQPQTSVMSGGSFSGFDIDLANYNASHTTRVPPDFSPVVTADRDQELHDGQLDMVIATYSDTPQRERLVDMAGPYMRTDEGILVTTSTHDITQLSDLKGKTVCTTTGSTTAAP